MLHCPNTSLLASSLRQGFLFIPHFVYFTTCKRIHFTVVHTEKKEIIVWTQISSLARASKFPSNPSKSYVAQLLLLQLDFSPSTTYTEISLVVSYTGVVSPS